MNALTYALANAPVARSLWRTVARVQETKFTHFGRPHHALASALVARSLWSTVARVQEDPIPSSTDLQSKQSASELC